MGATPTAWAADTGAGAARVSATSAHAELTGRHAETLRPLPRPAQRQPPRARRPLPGDQEAHQEGDQGNPGRLTRRDQPPTTADLVSGEVPTPAGLNHKLSPYSISPVSQRRHSRTGWWPSGDVPDRAHPTRRALRGLAQPTRIGTRDDPEASDGTPWFVGISASAASRPRALRRVMRGWPVAVGGRCRRRAPGRRRRGEAARAA